jgi:hypothetical protein
LLQNMFMLAWGALEVTTDPLGPFLDGLISGGTEGWKSRPREAQRLLQNMFMLAWGALEVTADPLGPFLDGLLCGGTEGWMSRPREAEVEA